MILSEILAWSSLLMKSTVLYFAYIALRWVFAKRKKWPETAPKMRFAVVVAARNEEAVIPRLVESLLGQEYPRELFDVYIVPNNCTDDTAGAALRAGANILSCQQPVHQKGDALRQAFEQLDCCGYDGYVVFDADNVVDRYYLKQTNDAFCAGAQVVKGRQVALNPKQSWVAGCYDMYFAGFDLLFNLPRANSMRSAKLVGTGFAVHRSVLKQLGGWNTQTIAEDAEFSAQCALAGVRVCWAPEAITYDEEPCSFWVSLRQRKRWCSGVLQVGRKMLPELAVSHRSTLCLDMLFFLLTAQLQPVSALLMITSQTVNLFSGNLSIQALVISVNLYWLICSMLAAVLQRISRGKESRNFRSVLLFPLFMLSWMPLQILALFHKTTNWQQIRHGMQEPKITCFR